MVKPLRTRALTLIIAATVFHGCATPAAYYHNMNSLVAAGRYGEAAAAGEQSRQKVYGRKNELLYHLDRGFLLHIAGSYAESNEAFENAKRVANEHFTKSVTAEASTLLVSDNMRPYYGEDFERALIHVFCALNYVLMGRESEALVEARQVDHFLKTLRTNYNHKSGYTEDAFARYLMGMIYENQGAVNDAYISYYKALENYDSYAAVYGVPVPKKLIADTFRTARALGFSDDVRALEKKWGKVEAPAPDAGCGEVVVIGYNGLAPVKVDSFFEISFGRAWSYVEAADVEGEEEEQVEQARAIARNILAEEQVRMAFPKYVPAEYRVSVIDASVISNSGAAPYDDKAETVENIGALAKTTLAGRIARVRVRTIIRAAVKFALTHNISRSVAKNSNDELLGWLVKKTLSIASTATELSDKRSWRSLPDTISMARLTAPAGACRLSLTMRDAAGAAVGTSTIENVTVRPGKKTFIIIRTAQ